MGEIIICLMLALVFYCAGRRVRRGLFISSSGIMINADVNGNLNIMRLGLEKQNVKLDVVEEILRPENKRFMLNPVRLCYI